MCYDTSMYDFVTLKQSIKHLEEWLIHELASIRTGRAAPAILDFIQVEAYGGKMGLRELANIILEDVKTIRIEPWDVSILKSIEKAIVGSNLGLSVMPFDKGVRVAFPELTAERREQFAKLAKQKLEEARTSLRGLRDKTWNDVQAKEKEGGMGEDDKFRLKDEMQKIIDEINTKFDKALERKIGEIKS